MDVDGIINFTPVAGILAAMITDTATDAREGIIFFYDAQCVLETTFADERDVTLRPLTGRTGVAARGDALLIYGIGVGNGLGV